MIAPKHKQFGSLYESLRQPHTEWHNAFEKMNGLLREQGVDGFEFGTTRHPLVAVVQKHGTLPENLLAKVEIAIARSMNLDRKIQQFMDEHDEGFQVQRKQMRTERWDERVHLWKLWGERTVRWVAGVFIALALYSVAVNLADGSLKGTLHIPVRELFHLPNDPAG